MNWQIWLHAAVHLKSFTIWRNQFLKSTQSQSLWKITQRFQHLSGLKQQYASLNGHCHHTFPTVHPKTPCVQTDWQSLWHQQHVDVFNPPKAKTAPEAWQVHPISLSALFPLCYLTSPTGRRKSFGKVKHGCINICLCVLVPKALGNEAGVQISAGAVKQQITLNEVFLYMMKLLRGWHVAEGSPPLLLQLSGR